MCDIQVRGTNHLNPAHPQQPNPRQAHNIKVIRFQTFPEIPKIPTCGPRRCRCSHNRTKQRGYSDQVTHRDGVEKCDQIQCISTNIPLNTTPKIPADHKNQYDAAWPLQAQLPWLAVEGPCTHAFPPRSSSCASPGLRHEHAAAREPTWQAVQGPCVQARPSTFMFMRKPGLAPCTPLLRMKRITSQHHKPADPAKPRHTPRHTPLPALPKTHYTPLNNKPFHESRSSMSAVLPWRFCHHCCQPRPPMLQQQQPQHRVQTVLPSNSATTVTAAAAAQLRHHKTTPARTGAAASLPHSAAAAAASTTTKHCCHNNSSSTVAHTGTLYQVAWPAAVLPFAFTGSFSDPLARSTAAAAICTL